MFFQVIFHTDLIFQQKPGQKSIISQLGQPPLFRQVVAPPLTFIRALPALPQLCWWLLVCSRDDHPSFSPPKRAQKMLHKYIIDTKNDGPGWKMKLLFGIHALNFVAVRSLKLTVQPLKSGLKMNLSVVCAVSFREGSSARMSGLHWRKGWGEKSSLQLSSH